MNVRKIASNRSYYLNMFSWVNKGNVFVPYVDGGDSLGILDWITVRRRENHKFGLDGRELNHILGTVVQGELEEVLEVVSAVYG